MLWPNPVSSRDSMPFPQSCWSSGSYNAWWGRRWPYWHWSLIRPRGHGLHSWYICPTASPELSQDFRILPKGSTSIHIQKPSIWGYGSWAAKVGRAGLLPQCNSNPVACQKTSTYKTYYKIWQNFLDFVGKNQFDPLSREILLFLQSGSDLGLGLKTLKVQVLALSALTDTWWALKPLIEHFLKAVLRLKLPKKNIFYPKWNLPLVLNLLVAPPFTPT